jgi:hypothetical protein
MKSSEYSATSPMQSSTPDLLPDDFATLEELWGFWDTHSTADYEDAISPVEIEVKSSSSKVYLPVAKDLLGKLRVQARRQGVSPETLINLLLQERLSTAT